jgi:subtilisin family serine protease
MALAVTPESGTPEQVFTALEWLMSLERPDGSGFGVDIVNLSMCTTTSHNGVDRAVYSKEYRLAIRNLRARGITVVAAIGNSGPWTHGSPANYKSVIGVGALDRSDRPWPKCCCGHPRHGRFKPDLCATGVDVWSALPGNKYGPKTGTSQAAPLVSGLTALMIQQGGRRNPMKSILRSRSRRVHPGPCSRRAFKIQW